MTAEQCNYLLLHCASFISLVLDFYFFHILISALGELQDSRKQGIAIIEFAQVSSKECFNTFK